MGRLNGNDSGFVGPPFQTFTLTYTYPNALIEIGKEANELLRLYPNPASERINLVYNIHTNGNIAVYDMSGKCVRRQEVRSSEHEIQIDVSRLVAGNYIIECTTTNRRYTTKFVKE